MIKLVIFDIGKVILNFDHHLTSQSLAGFCPYSEPEIYNMIFEDLLFYDYEEGKVSSKTYFRRIKEKLSLEINYDHFFCIWGDIFTMIAGMEDIVSRLQNKVKLYALSNTDEMHFLYLKDKFRVFNYFERIILSYEVHARKPDYAIYKETLRQAEIPADNSLFIDDIAQNVDAFIELGGHGKVFKGTSDLAKYLAGYNLIEENG
ncbi:MAG: HAD-IA family hydrolase [Actinomycetota bacterium]|nr:HAD-IA family hydrolase [Actinomycetota bacterium]